MIPTAAADFVLVGASELVTCAGPAPARGGDQSRTGVIDDGALAAREGVLTWVGPRAELGGNVRVDSAATRVDAGGRAVLPGLVDTHTHLVWAGDRAAEFERRLAGESYSAILAEGGGILSTVRATREASREQLTLGAARRLTALAAHGVTAVEIKSGYGLETDTELRLLRAAGDAAEGASQAVVRTFLGAHTLPAEHRSGSEGRERYVRTVIEEMIPRVAEEGLARYADVFIDEHAFRLPEARRVLEAALAAGLGLKLHTGQLDHDGGSKLAAELGAASVDHLEYLDDASLEALAGSETVAVLLPGATLFLRMQRFADGRRMIDAGVPVAVATDMNPGSCPSPSLPLMLQLACLYGGLSVDEAIVAGTLNAAAASGLDDRCGSLEPGKRCDLLVLDAPCRRELIYNLGAPPIRAVYAGGSLVAGSW